MMSRSSVIVLFFLNYQMNEWLFIDRYLFRAESTLIIFVCVIPGRQGEL